MIKTQNFLFGGFLSSLEIISFNENGDHCEIMAAYFTL
jgi:hypothetical protein